MVATTSAGDLLRSWRQRRRFSQRDLGARAASTARHIGDLESGQAAASHEMLIRLAEALSIPIRDRNALLTAAGYAPLYSDTAPDAPAFPRAALDEMLAAAEPNPAVAIDGHWTIQASNKAAWRLFAGVDPLLTSAPANLLRLCLHPEIGRAHV